MDYRIDRVEGYIEYHKSMVTAGDCDPAYPALRYIANRFELNIEQRYWLAWLYSISYSAPTAYYMISEFPDYENVDVGRLAWWWENNKSKCVFQTDRAKVKNFNMLVRMFVSYKNTVGKSQEKFYLSLKKTTPEATYDAVFKSLGRLFYFGRFSLFLLTESVYELTGFPMKPTGLDLRDAESCRNGLLYAVGKEKWIDSKGTLNKERYEYLQASLVKIHDMIRYRHAGIPTTYWNIETTLCAYKKLFYQTRYFGYYIDRMLGEIKQIERLVTEGVDWSVLWDFRREQFDRQFLGEYNGWAGVRKERFKLVMDTGNIAPDVVHNYKYKKEVMFDGSGGSYLDNTKITL